jgi:brefeldin A-inhibited guanine nucleotide-exchange protein
MKQLPNLLKQESSAAATYINILLRMYNDTKEERLQNKDTVEEALIPYNPSR